MKNFFKKLSFVLALAMVLTSVAPATASAAAKNFIKVNGTSTTVTTSKPLTVWIGGVVRNLDYSINGKTSGVSGKWTSSKKSVATVNAKTGVVTPVANGTTTITFTAENGTKVSGKVYVRTRATSINVWDAEYKTAYTKNDKPALEMKAGTEVKVGLSMNPKKGGKTATYRVYAESDKEDVATVTVSNAIGTREATVAAKAAGEATLTFVAAQSMSMANAKAAKYHVENTVKVVVTEDATLAAKQTAANVVTVTGKDLTDAKADYKISLGKADKTIDKVVVNDAKTEATITLGSSTMVEGTYTVSFGAVTVDFPAGPSKATKIVVDPKSAILDINNPTSRAIAYYKVFDQFETDITKKAEVNITGSDNVATNSTTAGELVFTNTTTGYNLNLSQVSVSIVEKNTAVFCSEILTVTEAAKLKTVTFEGLYKVEGGAYKKVDRIPEGTSQTQIQNNYKLLVTAVDQYDREATKSIVGGTSAANLSINLSSITGLKAEVPTTNSTVEIDGKDYAIVNLDVNNTNHVAEAGEVTVLGIVLTSGNTFTEKFNVSAAVKIESLTVTAPNGVYGNQDNVLDYVALDTEGNEVTDIDTLCILNDSKYIKDNGELFFVGSADGTAVLKYRAASNTSTMNITKSVSWVTPTLKYGYATLDIKPNRYAVAVAGIWTDAEKDNGVFLAETIGDTMTIAKKNLKLEDQYGNLLDKGTHLSEITIATEVENKPDYLTVATDSATNTGVVTFAAVGAGAASSSSVRVKFKTLANINGDTTKDTKNEYTFNFYVANVNDVANWALSVDHGTYYTSGSTIATAVPTVKGYYAGKQLKARTADFTIIDVTPSSIDKNISGIDATLDATAKVVIKNNVGTVLTKDFKKSNAPAKVLAANAYAGGCKFAGGYTTVTAGALLGSATNWGASYKFGNILFAMDQYDNMTQNGVQIVTGTGTAPTDLGTPRVTLSNLPADTDMYSLQDNGTADVKLQFNPAAAGRWFTIKANFAWADGYSYDAVLVFSVVQ